MIQSVLIPAGDAVPEPKPQANMLLTIFGFLCGMTLGVRFNVIVLVPALLVAWLLVAATGVVAGSSAGSIVIGMALVALAVQAGYLAGVGLQWALQAGRYRPRHARNSWSSNKPAVAPDRAV